MTVYLDKLHLSSRWGQERAYFSRLLPENRSAFALHELHLFAGVIRVPDVWFNHLGWPHYVLTMSKYHLALALGAQPLDIQEYARRQRDRT